MSNLDPWFNKIYEDNFDMLVKVAYYILQDKNILEDIVQSAFAALLFKREQLRNHPNIAGWLVKTVPNLADNEQNKAWRTQEVRFLPDYEPAANGPQENFISLLPPELTEDQKRVLYYRLEVRLSHEEIAAHLGCSSDASRMRYSRALKRCKELMEKNK